MLLGMFSVKSSSSPVFLNEDISAAFENQEENILFP